MNYKNHLKMGHKEVTHKEKQVASSLNSQSFQASLNRLRSLPRRVGVIPPGFEHRADLIADLFYGSPTLDSVVCWINNLSDPFQQLTVGDSIVIVELI